MSVEIGKVAAVLGRLDDGALNEALTKAGNPVDENFLAGYLIEMGTCPSKDPYFSTQEVHCSSCAVPVSVCLSMQCCMSLHAFCYVPLLPMCPHDTYDYLCGM